MRSFESVMVGLGLMLVLAAGCDTSSAPPAPQTQTPPLDGGRDAADRADSARPLPDAVAASAQPSSGEVASPPTTKATEAAAKGPAGPKKEKEVAATVDQKKDDQVKEFEPLFTDWPQPKLVLLFTGQQIGYIEPCGCTGLANQKGGLARRHSLVKQLAERGWDVVPIDLGNQVRRFGRQAELQFQTSAEALKKIGYRAIALGADDLRLSSGELAASVLGSDENPSPFVSANAAVLDRSLTPIWHVLEAAGKRIGVTSVVGPSSLEKISSDEIARRSAEEGLGEVLPLLEQANCDLRILLVQGTLEESRKLAAAYPQFQIVATAGGLAEPPYQPEPVDGSEALFVEVGIKGMYVSVVGVFDDRQTPFRYQRVPLDSRFADSPEMLDMLASYQEQLQTLGFEGLGLKPAPHPSGRKFVGSATCGECHTKAFAKFQETTHATALQTLVRPGERSEIARHFDPECLSCHVTGWNPQKYFPYLSGYLGLKETPLLGGNGCENCHGPGSAHVAAENGDGNPTDDVVQQLRNQMRLPLRAAEQKCLECHDTDNSPEFHKPGAFEKYWHEIAHPGVD